MKNAEVIRQRRNQANYLLVAENDFELLGVGAKTLDENPTAQTKSKRYVCDKSLRKSISGYDWSTAFDIDQIRSQAAINFIINIGEKQLVGEDAETEYIIVDLDQKDETDGKYHARKFDIAVEIASFTNDDGDMGCTGNFLGKGDPIEGKFDIKTKTFIPESEAA